MGATPSKPGEHASASTRKALKSRSSLNLLKRSRTPSTSTRASCPLPVTEPVDGVGRFEIPIPSSGQPVTKCRDDFLQSSTAEKIDDGSKSISSVSTTVTATRLTTPTQLHKHGVSSSASEKSRSTPPPSLTPKILLPTTSMLPEDSPTKYGIRLVPTPSPDKKLLRAQRKDMTGPGLFAHAVAQLKACHSAFSDLAQRQNLFSHSSPCLLSSTAAQHSHTSSTISRSSRPATGYSSSHELLTKGTQYYQAVHALPMTPCQRDCFHHHDGWHPAAKPRYNSMHPVSCAVCDGYGAPSEGHDTAGDDFKRCNWCWVIVCGRCYDAFVNGGSAAMVEREERVAERSRVLVLVN